MPSPYDQLWSLPMRTLDPDLRRLTALVDGPDRPTWLVEWVDFEAWTPEAGARLEAAVRALDPHWDVDVAGSPDAWSATVVRRDEPATEMDEVAVTSFSTGTAFAFEPRRSLPITPV